MNGLYAGHNWENFKESPWTNTVPPPPGERWKMTACVCSLINEPDEVNFPHAGLEMNNLRPMPSGKVRHSIYEPQSHNHSPKHRAMKSLLHAATLTIAILATGLACRAQNVYSINGVVEGTFLAAKHRPDEIAIWGCRDGSGAQASRVEWYVSTNALAKQPRWDGLSAEVPLSARKACALALPLVRERLPHVRSWAVESILLRKPYLGEPEVYPDVWYYEIHFKPRSPQDPAEKEYDTRHCAATQIVLLDGTVLPQTVLKRK